MLPFLTHIHFLLSHFSLTSLFCSELPPIVTEEQRLDYKREFDGDHMEYKRIQAELDDVNLGLAEVDKELDRLKQGSPQFLVGFTETVF